MSSRSLLLAVTAITLACSGKQQIGTDGPGGPDATGGSSGAPTAGSGGDTVVGQAGSAAGTGAIGGSELPSSNGGADAGSTGDTAGSPSSGGASAGAGGSAGADQSPARLVFFYTPLGTALDSWRAAAQANNTLALSGILAPLEPVKDHLLVVDGIDNLAQPGVPATTNPKGPVLLLTGTVAGGPSLDVFLGEKQTAAFPDVQLGVQSGIAITYTGPNAPSFGSTKPATAAAILLPPGQDTSEFATTSDFAATGHQQMDLIRLAIQYDRTRFLSLSWGDVGGTTLFSWVPGVDKTYSALAANSGSAGADRDHFIAVQTWYAQQFAYLVGGLAGIPEGTGSLLDHTLVVWISETGEASLGTGKNIPVVIAGNMHGRFRNGAYVKISGSQANLLSTISNAAGFGNFGDTALGNAPIAALLN
jgi:hypothetical protein